MFYNIISIIQTNLKQMSNQYKEIQQYSCKCGKAFSGKPEKIKMILKLHYKICEYSRSQDTNIAVITSSGNNPHSLKRVNNLSLDFETTPLGLSEMRKFIGST